MKALLLLLLFIVVVPLLIGRLAGLSSKSGGGLVPLATMAGLLTLFALYIVFIDKKPEDKQQKVSSSIPSDNYEFACSDDEYTIEKEQREGADHEELPCNQPVDCPY